MDRVKNQPFFNPKNVLYHFAKLESEFLPCKRTSKEFRKCVELKRAAIFTLGLVKYYGRPIWLKAVEDSEGFPDARSIFFDDRKECYYQDIELTEFTDHSSESLIKFLLETKLKKGNYDNKTNILVWVNRKIKLAPISFHRENLESINSNKAHVYLIGRAVESGHIYHLHQVAPRHKKISTQFDALIEARKCSYNGVITPMRYDPPRDMGSVFPFDQIANR